MADVINLGQRVSSVDVSPQFQPYSKVIIHINDDEAVEVGNNTGRVLEIDNPLGSREMAQNILNRLSGYQYQPYQADGALLDPAAEIGDAVGTATSYGGLYTRSRKFGRLMKADISAPHDEEINHEFKYESPQERKFTRVTGEIRASLIITSNMIQSEVAERKAQGDELSSRLTQTSNAITAEVSRATEAEGNLSASLSIQASEIAAKVDSSGGGGSFSWVLNSSSHTWKANNVEVMRVSASGLWVKGQIEATSGKIGGFDIGSNALSYNDLTWGDTSKNYGAYIGQSGIQLGKNFSVDNGGNLKASNITLSGTLNIGGQAITADALRQGAQQSYNNYSSWNGTTSTVNSNGSYWSGGASYGYGYGNAISRSSGVYPSYFRASDIYAENGLATGYVNCTGNCVVSGRFYLGGYPVSWKSTTIQGVTLYYLGR